MIQVNQNIQGWFDGDSMDIYGDLMGFYSDLMGFTRVYPLANV